VRYMHSDVDTLERIEIIRDLRLGAFDVLIGINLLREGLDIPECACGVADMVGDSEAAGKIKDEANSYTPTGRKKRGKIDRRAMEMAEDAADYVGGNMQAVLADLETKMFQAAENLEFEEAARLRDEMHRLKEKLD